jgi:hypothetical protein
MSAGASPTGGIGGMFYFLLLVVGMVQRYDKKARRSNAKFILPTVLIIVVVIIITINFVFWSNFHYNFSLPRIITPSLGLFEILFL